ncbi:hypothetical protein JT358_13055 [Micrococcales bacterium 31B]|nr:hypothetical protein [Micrococcales bacterium 31B]
MSRHFTECIGEHLEDASPCSVKRDAARAPRFRDLDQRIALAGHATYLPLSDLTCTDGTCPIVSDALVVYRDKTHMTAAFAARLTSVFDQSMRFALEN